MVDIGTNNVGEDELNTGIEYTMVRLENWHNTCKRGVIGYIRVLRTICSDELNGLSWYGFNSWVWNVQWVWNVEKNIEKYSKKFSNNMWKECQ